ncbi:MAG: glycosyltransferase, partial [Microgenomates group bacterium]
MTISLIIPCYNEEANIQKGVLDRIGNYTGERNYFKEVIIVDDGSSDDSAAIVKKEYLTHFPKFRLIENAHAGKGEAVISGIEAAKG